MENVGEGWRFPHIPQPPEWTVEWEAIAARFAWVRALAETPQEPAHHAEGDVATHTRKVVEALAGMEAWRALPADERGITFAAALLHDVAKPARTRVEPDGRITSPGHARLGERLTRAILWGGDGLDAPAPLPARETICALVRFHGLPLWLLDKADPVRAAVEASPRARLDLVALVAEADVRGRIAADRDALLERVALFRAFCEEWGCLRAPYAFASDHARFVYFHERKADPAYAAYDDTTFEVILMSGLPGAGKDTWIARNHPDLPVVSLDRIRRELKVAPDEDQGAVAQAAKARARELLRRHEPFIWNATNVTRALRGQLVDLFASYGARVRIVYVEAPHAELLRRNERREASVPGPVIAKLARKLEIPDLTEAQTVEWVWEE
jgi:predicted kinase